ncbi:hypothetical protein QCA50_000257 [Cerrena zonata]|uniref:Transcription initiation factor TFIID subunit 8 n=1 Tax=Cerrena zonata TaxID=2478898 RepID=A0AAW0GSJ1_9APHY
MSAAYYPPSQSYETYQGQGTYPNYTPQAQYNNQYAQSGSTSYAGYPPSSPAPEPISAPDIPAITSEIASRIIQRLISSELHHAGFDAAQPATVLRLEQEVVAFLENIFRFAHDSANHGNRSGPIATDLLAACKHHELEVKDLRKLVSAAKKRKIELEDEELVLPSMIPPPSRSPSPELLSSDDEDAPPMVPTTLRGLPLNYLPALPPKHTYLRTPASPPKKAALPSLEKKLKNAGLVQESLKNLLLATEDSADQDGELLGAIVNWESTTHPRKRWRVSP